MKILALDLGDVWTGTAISDELGLTASPYQTIKSSSLITFLRDIQNTEDIKTIVIGYPKTLSGNVSEQTKKVITQKERLELIFPDITWIFWDERLTSKQAAQTKKIRSKEEKIASHAIAAAFILTGYLLYAYKK